MNPISHTHTHTQFTDGDSFEYFTRTHTHIAKFQWNSFRCQLQAKGQSKRTTTAGCPPSLPPFKTEIRQLSCFLQNWTHTPSINCEYRTLKIPLHPYLNHFSLFPFPLPSFHFPWPLFFILPFPLLQLFRFFMVHYHRGTEGCRRMLRWKSLSRDSLLPCHLHCDTVYFIGYSGRLLFIPLLIIYWRLFVPFW